MFDFRRPGSRHHCGWQLFAKVWYIWFPLEVAAGPATILNDRSFVPMSVNECVSESVLSQGLSVEMLLCTLRCVAKDCVLICCWSEVLVPSQRLTGQADFIARPHHNERLKNGGVYFLHFSSQPDLITPLVEMYKIDARSWYDFKRASERTM